MPEEPKKALTIAPPSSLAEIDAAGLDLESLTLEASVTKELSELQFRQLKRISYYTSKVGLPLQESCKLLDINYDDFMQLLESNSGVKKVLEMKDISYKKDLLYTLSTKARQGDDKLAQWLLERRYPTEFSTKRGQGGGGDEDILFQAIEFIQKNGDNSPLIKETSGRAFIVKKGPSIQSMADGLKALLK